jgi:hypothetical protein
MALAVALTGLSYLAHATSPSLLHLDEAWWAKTVDDHATRPVFKVRPFTTAIVQTLHDEFGVGYRTGWFSLQFTLMFMSCWVFYLYLTSLGFSKKASLSGELLFGLSPPVFMAHFEPMYTWSDFWVYLLVPLSILLLHKRQLPLATIAFGLALAAREVTILFLPVWSALAYRQEKSVGNTFMWSAVTILLFVSIRMWMTGAFRSPAELQLGFNFEHALRGWTTLFSVWLACGAFWIIGLYYATIRLRSGHRDPFAWGAWLVSAGYVSSTLLLARAFETRLMFPPAILLIPLVLWWVTQRKDVIATIRTHLRRWKWQLLLLGLAIVGILIIRFAFPTFENRRWKDGNWLLAGLHLAGALFFLLVEYRARRARTAS